MTMDGAESEKIVDFGIGLERELNDCRKKCVDLESKIWKKSNELELLEGKFEALAVEKLAIEEELRVLKIRYEELENASKVVGAGEKGMGRNIDLTEETDEEQKVFKFMIENKVLECEKKKAESEVEVWKAKFKALESRVLELEHRDGEYHLVIEVKGEPGLSEMGAKEISDVRGLKDGSSIATGSAHLEAENKVIDVKETIHASASGFTNRHNSLKGFGDFQISADTPHKQSTHDEGGNQGSLSGTDHVYGGQVRKQLAFGEGSPSKKIAPSTPGGVKSASVGVIDICDSDAEPVSIGASVSTDSVRGNMNIKASASENKMKNVFSDQSDEEEMGGYKGGSPFIVTPRRKRASNIVNSDTENEDDDNVPIGTLKADILPELDTDFQPNSCSDPATVSGEKVQESGSRRRLVSLRNSVSTSKRKRASNIVASDVESEDDDDNVPICKRKTNLLPESNTEFQFNSCSVPSTVSGGKVQESVSRRRLASLRKFEDKWLQKGSSTSSNLNTIETDCYPGTSTKDDGEDADMEGNGSESEGESLGGFIVDGSDVSENSDSADGLSRNSESGADSGDSENTSDDNINLGEILSKFRRNRDHKSKWELEADMLAAFGKDDELCMKAVCALYRQQTSEEKYCRGTIYNNQRGFSQCDAHRGTALAEFLTDGDPEGDLQKSLKELKEYNPQGVELCKKLATHYSKQLFEIYKNKEDPLFLPS